MFDFLSLSVRKGVTGFDRQVSDGMYSYACPLLYQDWGTPERTDKPLFQTPDIRFWIWYQ
jgi:hypothetical protein